MLDSLLFLPGFLPIACAVTAFACETVVDSSLLARVYGMKWVFPLPVGGLGAEVDASFVNVCGLIGGSGSPSLYAATMFTFISVWARKFTS